MAVERVSDRSFRSKVLRQDGPVVLFFTAAFCDASQELLSAMEELEAAFDGQAKVLHLDLGKSATRARGNKVVRRYRVSRLPLVMVFSEGQVRDYIGGVPSFEDLRDMVERQLQPVKDVGEHNFRQEVLESSKPVLVHFHSADCEPSLAMLEVVEETAKHLSPRAKVVRVEANAFNAGLCARYGAIRFPMLAAFEGGEMRDCILGPVSQESLRADFAGERAPVEHIAEMVESVRL